MSDFEKEHIERMKDLRAEILDATPAEDKKRIETLLYDYSLVCIEIGKDKRFFKMPALPKLEAMAKGQK